MKGMKDQCMPSIRPAMAASLAASDPSLLHAPNSGGSVAKPRSLPSGGHFLTFRPLPEARLRHRRLRSNGLQIAASASASGNSNGLDDLAARLMDAARSLSHRTGQVVESAWLRGVKFVESQDLEGKMKQSLSSANQKLEELSYDARKGAEKFDRRFRVSERAQEMADFASQQVKDADQQFGLVQKFRNASSDFQRNWPTYRRQLNQFLQTPVGQTLTTLVFLWFLLSGWLFRIILISMWVLPFAAPLLIRSAARNMIVEGACPSCKRRFIGNRSQMVMCNYCKAVVWQPREDLSKDGSDPSIIDVDID